MSNAVFSAKVRGLDFSLVKTPEFSTIVQEAPSRYTTRILQSQNPIWHYSLVYNYLRDDPSNIASGLTYTDLKTLMGFYLSRQGQFDDFLFSDPDDKSVSNQTLSVVTDGSFLLLADSAKHGRVS
jgi:hypothetical protein